jgi:threonine/homoserine efflux transporter RhtA
MSEFKTLLSSKTFWGALVAVLASVLSLFGYQIGVAEQSELISIGTGFAGAAGGLFAIYGRIVASKRIGSGGGQ